VAGISAALILAYDRKFQSFSKCRSKKAELICVHNLFSSVIKRSVLEAVNNKDSFNNSDHILSPVWLLPSRLNRLTPRIFR